jgi:DNA invertase Pin-like site-specific DNA recombinase
MLIGYARVSRRDQETEMQYALLERAGCTIIYFEKAKSIGKRPELQRALAALKPGDKLVVYKLDRIARSLRDLLNILQVLQERGSGFHSLTEAIDTSTPVGRFTVQILGAVAEFERELIRERSMAGQAAAQARGSIIGRKRTLTDQQELDLVSRYDMMTLSISDVAKEFAVSPSVAKRAIYRVKKPHSSSLQ